MSEELDKLRRWYREANEADESQAEREREDEAFADGNQWPQALLNARQGQTASAGVPAVPARPCLVINKTQEPVRQILNQERAADIGIEITPADDFGDLGITPDDAEITLREGLVRRIQRDSHAADARTWAFTRAVIAGRGFYTVRNRYLPGKTYDQEVYVDRILNQASVKLDPAHEQPDGSDCEYQCMGAWCNWEKFKSEYPTDADGKKINMIFPARDAEFVGTTEEYPDWFEVDEGKKPKAVRIVDFWYQKRTSRELSLCADGKSYWSNEVPKGLEVLDTRTVVEKKIKFCKIAGGQVVLERTDEPGPNMPIIKVVGIEVPPYDGQRRYEGIIRAARGSQEAFNYMVSKMVEMIGLSPIPPLMVDSQTYQNYKAQYDQMNTRAFPAIPFDSYDDQNRPLAPPTRPNLGPDISPVAGAVQMFDAMIKSTTAVPDSTLGNVDPALKSGKAINAVVQNAQMSTSNFLDNLVRSMQYEGQVINGKLQPIYGARPGRLVRTLTGEGEDEQMMVGQPPGPVDPNRQALLQKAKQAKLTKDAHFNVVIKITKGFESRRTQEYTELGQLISAEPNLMGWVGDLYFKNSDMPNRQQLAERAKVMLVPQIQEMLAKQEQGQNFDPAAQAQIQQMQQQLQELQQYAQQAQKAIETKQIESQARIQEAQAKAQADAQKAKFEAQRDLELEQLKANLQIELQKMQDATTIRVAEINAQTKGLVTGHELQHEAEAMGVKMQHEQQMAQMSQDHERGMAETQAMQAQQMAEADRQAEQNQQQETS